MAQSPDSHHTVTVASPVLRAKGALHAAGVVAEASRALWLEEVPDALRRTLELLVRESLVSRASVVIDGDAEPILIEVPAGTSSTTPLGGLTVPIVWNQRRLGSIAADVSNAQGHNYTQLTGLLESLAMVIGPAVASRRATQTERTRLAEENARLRERLHARHDLSSIVGNSEAMRHVCNLVARAAPVGTPVLLCGEPGTGKEFLARAIHHASPWARRPFFEVSCGQLNAGHLEIDLIEHLRSRDPARTRESLSDGGTLFLDDLSELAPVGQGQLMRVLQQREFGPATSSAGTQTQVRVIAATDVDLEHAVGGRFRADLYHRLSGFTIAVPPLRDRKADIPVLAEFFLEKYACEHGKGPQKMSARALNMLSRYSWPGNVRELANVIERAVLLSEDGLIHGHHLSPAIHAADASGATASFSLSESLDAYEKDLLVDALRSARGVRSRAARLLQTTDRIINYKIRKHAIDCRRFKD